MLFSVIYRWIIDLAMTARAHWRALGLTTKFLIVAIIPIGFNLLILGGWVSRQVADGVVHQSATATALYVDSFVEPLVQTSRRRTI